MENVEPNIRNAVRALIIRDRHILLLRKGGDARGERYALPGGAQDAGETLKQALYRECMEEIDTEVDILDLIHVADYHKQRSGPPVTTRHQIEFVFACAVADSYIPHSGSHPDGHQLEVIWASLNNLMDMPLVPKSMAAWIVNPDKLSRIYMGLIH